MLIQYQWISYPEHRAYLFKLLLLQLLKYDENYSVLLALKLHFLLVEQINGNDWNNKNYKQRNIYLYRYLNSICFDSL